MFALDSAYQKADLVISYQLVFSYVFFIIDNESYNEGLKNRYKHSVHDAQQQEVSNKTNIYILWT